MSVYSKMLAASSALSGENFFYYITTTAVLPWNHPTVSGGNSTFVGYDGDIYIGTNPYSLDIFGFYGDGSGIKFSRRVILNSDDTGGLFASATDTTGYVACYARAEATGSFDKTNGSASSPFKAMDISYYSSSALASFMLESDGAHNLTGSVKASAIGQPEDCPCIHRRSASGVYNDLYVTNTFTSGARATAVHADASGNLYLGGGTNTTIAGGGWFAKWNSSYTGQWHTHIDRGASDLEVTSIATDDALNVYVGYVQYNTKLIFIAKFNSSGTLQWCRYWYPPNGTFTPGFRPRFPKVAYTNGKLFVCTTKKNSDNTTYYHPCIFEVDPSTGGMSTGDVYEIVQNLGHTDSKLPVFDFAATQEGLVLWGYQGGGTNNIVITKVPQTLDLFGSYGSGSTGLTLRLNAGSGTWNDYTSNWTQNTDSRITGLSSRTSNLVNKTVSTNAQLSETLSAATTL